jgi:hypothetical protein
VSRSPFVGLLLGVAGLFLAASFWARFLDRAGPYRAYPFLHLVGVVALAVGAVLVARRTVGRRWARRFVAFVGAAVAVASALVLWGFLFVGSRLPEGPPPRIAVAPQLALADQSGEVVHLSRLLESGPVVVAFFRGAFDGWARARSPTWSRRAAGARP